MGAVHELVIREGLESARAKAQTPEERRVVDLAARVLGEESDQLGITYAGFCMTSLPHKRPKDEQREWLRENGRFSLMIEPGKIIRQGQPVFYGIPYGARARMILLYLCTEAIRTNSRRVEIGRSMRAWLGRLGIAIGGESYTAVREQANRISACRMTIAWRGDNGTEGFKRENIIDGMMSIPQPREPDQGSLWEDEIELTDSFFQALKAHPVPLWEPALRAISNQPLVIDLYVWLVYRLHAIKKPTIVGWKPLQAQFGAEYTRERDFRRRFKEALAEAVAVYPEAEIDVDERGVELRPSRPAVAPRGRVVRLPL
ncbi:RepA protein [Arboricoccus pini]|uniref:RepA protein n=1 Tax=Arboricoccus pini TaxID=1963835 RepID=A0A212RY65_9PROT|nr:replication protein RepA [Arboricoccus pini]SNB77692.1 RepA protein [Arboricoccus pini]